MLQLFRPELPAAAGVCTLVGQTLALGHFPPMLTAGLGFLAVFALSASALILNDLFDLEVDRVNAPHRPLPSGRVTPLQVIGLTAVTMLVGFTAAYGLGPWPLLLSIPIWLVGLLYNWRYKQAGLIGNLMVSSSVASTFLFGALSVGNLWNPYVWLFSLMGFFLDLGEEIAGDSLDMEGDRLRGSRSIPILKGRNFGLRLAFGLLTLVVLLSYAPVVLGGLGAWRLPYLGMITATNGLILYFAVRLLRSPSTGAGRVAMRGVYLSASLGMVLLLVLLLL